MDRETFEKKKKIIYEFVTDREYLPMKRKEMAVVLRVPADERKDFYDVLDSLRDEGKVEFDSKGKITLTSGSFLNGTFMAAKRGFGFVRVEGEDEDIYIPPQYVKNAMDGDKVKISLIDSKGGKKREAAIVSVISRENTIVVGTFSSSKSYGFVVPDNRKFNKDIYIQKADSMGAITGHKVVVEITDFGDEKRNPEGRILEIIGHINDPGVDILSVVKAYNLPEDYPDAVMKQCEEISDEISDSDIKGRKDYRNLQTVTIDGEDAKDLDDAITLQKDGNIYRLGVHIADVSEYVTEHSPLDIEARKRGTSVYLVDRVIPMLPHKLSNGICSLNQGTDRLALSCVMDINEKGEVVSHSIDESVINVDRRMSYTVVSDIVDREDKDAREEYKEFISLFEKMYELADILKSRRNKKGSIDFDFPESKIVLDKKGEPVSVEEYKRNNAHRIIEEFMLVANMTVAEEYFWQELPFVYRVHEKPDPEKMQQLGTFINNFGYILKTDSEGNVHSKEIQKLINRIENTPQEGLISRLSLRSMKQAKYTTECDGHFGLAFKYYCHFTSPIRRYPDLQIHRIIKENIHGELKSGRINHYENILPGVCADASALERRADEAEREVEKLKKAEYMQKHIGEIYEGVISGVTGWGLYVELPNTIEGMVRISDIPGDYYYFEEENYRLVGKNSGKTYDLGEKIEVIVTNADVAARSVDFEIYIPEEESDGKGK